jgi:hypothetical protein
MKPANTGGPGVTLMDDINKRVISKHRTLRQAVIAARIHQRQFEAANGQERRRQYRYLQKGIPVDADWLLSVTLDVDQFAAKGATHPPINMKSSPNTREDGSL